MRLWSIHPKYLDTAGLLAVWREGLLAQKVLEGCTTGYKNHPQLDRFKMQKMPLASLACFLQHIWEEASRRGFHFDKSKIKNLQHKAAPRIPVHKGQIAYEAAFLLQKMSKRTCPETIAEQLKKAINKKTICPHPLFSITNDETPEAWEHIKAFSTPQKKQEV